MRTSISQCITVALVCLWSMSFASPPAAAGTTGAIQGYVTDESGQGIAGARVTASSPSGDFSTTSGSAGFYSFNGLPLDTYTVAFSKDGYVAQSMFGNTAVQDQSIRVSVRLKTGAKTLARINVRSSMSLVQPAVTADAYVISQQRLSDINGTPQDLNANQAITALPGIMADPGGAPTIRAGASNDIGYELDGIDDTEIYTGARISEPPTLNGVHSLQLSTGGYDVSNGNTNSGVINEVINRGTYPAHGQATLRINSPVYGHELSFDYGGATPNNRFSYYFSFGGSRDDTMYGDGHTPLPLLFNSATFFSISDSIFNLFYHFGKSNTNELQFLSNISAVTVYGDYLWSPPLAPYASNNGAVEAALDPFGFGQPATFQSNYFTLFPGQVAYQQNTNQPGPTSINSFIDKINFKRQLTPSSFGEVRVFKRYQNWVDSYPYNYGAFSDYYRDVTETALGGAFDYTNQLSSKHEISFGGDGTYYATKAYQQNASSEAFSEPLEALGCPALATYLTVNAGLPGFPSTSTSGVGGCYIGPFNAAINSAFVARGFPNPGLPTDPAHAPLNTYVTNGLYSTDPVHRWDFYVRDRWQPNERLTVTFGLRWDKEAIAMPPNAAQLDTTYYFDDNGNLVTVPGQPIGTDVTQPQQISPRIAASWVLDSRDTVRFSYGKNIEFVPISFLEDITHVPASLQSCTIANGCFIPLPGGPGTPTCCTNHITNLYQQVSVDLNNSFSPPYTPLLPQTAFNLDFSYEHDFGRGVELRLTPYYRKESNYAIGYQTLLGFLPSGSAIFSPFKWQNGGINESTGIEFALQRNAPFGFSGLLAGTYDNTLSNFDNDGVYGVNGAALVAGHFYHVTYVAPLTATLNLAYNTPKGLHAVTTISYESGYRYGVGKKIYISDSHGAPVQVLNTDLADYFGNAYYLTNPANPGTAFAPNIVASRGTPEGDDPGTLWGPPITIVNFSISQDVGIGSNSVQVGMRVANLFGNYSPTFIPPNQFYGFSGYGNGGLPSGVNGNACAPGQTLGCQPFQYNLSAAPYEYEQLGQPRVFTFFVSAKY
jgi:hypothetical protein